MIVLPKGAFIVKADKVEEKTKGGIILDTSTQKEPNTGEIVFTSEELNKYQTCKVVFRANFAEDVNINGVDLKYFRDFDSSIYYVIIE